MAGLVVTLRVYRRQPVGGLIGRLIVNGSVHAVSGGGVQIISAIVAIAWDVVLVMLFAALRRLYGAQRPLCADLALLFMLLVCATSSINWFVQLTILPLLSPADTIALAVRAAHNELSITYAMEHLGWGLFLGLSVLSAAAVFREGGLHAWIRWLLIGVSLAIGVLMMVIITRGQGRLTAMGRDLRPVGSWSTPFRPARLMARGYTPAFAVWFGGLILLLVFFRR